MRCHKNGPNFGSSYITSEKLEQYRDEIDPKREAEEAEARQDEGHYHCQLKPYSIEHRIQSFLATFWLIYFLGCGRGDISYLLSLLA